MLAYILYVYIGDTSAITKLIREVSVDFREDIVFPSIVDRMFSMMAVFPQDCDYLHEGAPL